MRWDTISLGDIALRKGGSVDPKKHPDEVFELYSIPAFDAGAPAVVSGSAIGSSKKAVQPNDVMISRIVPHIRRACVVGQTNGHRQIASGEWIIFRDDSIWPQYLRRVLVGDVFHSAFMRTVSGVGGSLLRARPAEVFKIQIPLPPLAEQKRIAGILDAADALRAKRRESLAQLDTLLQSTFLDLFGDPVTNPMGWEVVELASLVERGDKINYGVVQPGDDCPDGKPLIRVGDFVSGILDTTNLKLIAPEIEKKYQRSRLNGHELLVSCVGSIGTVCKVSMEAEGLNIARAVARVPVKDGISRDFMLHCLRSKAVQRHFLKETRTVSQPTLNISLIKTAPVIQPPDELQHRFAEIVELIEQQKARQRAHLAELDTLFASLQQRAFRGKL